MERKQTSSTHWRESSVHSKAESSRSSDFRTEYTFRNVNFKSTIDTPTKSFQRESVSKKEKDRKIEEEQTRTKPRKFKTQKHLSWDERKTQIEQENKNQEGSLLAVTTSDNGIKILANNDGVRLIRMLESRAIDKNRGPSEPINSKVVLCFWFVDLYLLLG